jgi:hypothetical protein
MHGKDENDKLKSFFVCFKYSLRPILLFVNIDVFKHILVIDTFILEKSNMDRRE